MQLMDVKAFAGAHNLAISTVRSLCKDNVIPSTKIGLKWLIDVAGAEEVIRTKMVARVTPEAEPKRIPTIIHKRRNSGSNYLERLEAL